MLHREGPFVPTAYGERLPGRVNGHDDHNFAVDSQERSWTEPKTIFHDKVTGDLCHARESIWFAQMSLRCSSTEPSFYDKPADVNDFKGRVLRGVRIC